MNNNHLEHLYEQMSRGDDGALEQVFLSYEPYLRMVVRRQLKPRLRAKFDSSDIVQSIWTDVLRGLRENNWKFKDAAHLRAFLVKLTLNRFIDFYRHHRTPLEREQPLMDVDVASVPATRQDRPSELAQANELWDQLMTLCPPAHRPLLKLKTQGATLSEMAAKTGLHESSIRRILYELARRYDALNSESTESHRGAG